MHLEKGFNEHYYVQTKILISGTMWKSSSEREQPFLMEFVSILNACFIQYNATLVEYVNVAQ